MAKYVWNEPNILHVPGVMDPKGDVEKNTPGAIFAPGMPVELDDKDAERPLVKALIDAKKLTLATDEDEEKAAQVEAERQRENMEAETKAREAGPRTPGQRR